ncbi:hypothetical protein RZS08_30745, partial [Arthrospira platensis SPKY1]|nr:hypothetical protein [Arthrospira platensis SPKY1]
VDLALQYLRCQIDRRRRRFSGRYADRAFEEALPLYLQGRVPVNGPVAFDPETAVRPGACESAFEADRRIGQRRFVYGQDPAADLYRFQLGRSDRLQDELLCVLPQAPVGD